MPITFKENLNFATAVGKIRALSARLFTPADWERLLTAKTTKDLMRLLIETPYGRIISDADNFDNIQHKLVYHLLSEMNELEKVLPEKEFLYYFRYKIDLGNIKRVLYGILSKKDVALYEGGLIPLEILERIKNSRDIELLKNLPYPWDILREIEEEPVFWTYYLEQAYFKGLIDLSRVNGYSLLESFLARQIDLENLKIALRIKTVNYPDRYKSFFYSGGTIEIRDYIRLLDMSLESWKDSELVERLDMKEYLDKPIILEKRIEESLIELLSISKYTAFGYEPVLDYFFRKEIEHKNILFIFSGLEYGLPIQTLRSGIRGL
ncbi:MAG: V-type ATPase subunit [bacterium]|nr:V-type ATPase subunit [bacterium]